MNNVRTLGQLLLGEKYQQEEREEVKKNIDNSGNYILPAMPIGSFYEIPYFCFCLFQICIFHIFG